MVLSRNSKVTWIDYYRGWVVLAHPIIHDLFASLYMTHFLAYSYFTCSSLPVYIFSTFDAFFDLRQPDEDFLNRDIVQSSKSSARQ